MFTKEMEMEMKMKGLSLVVAVVAGVGLYAASAGAGELATREFKARMSGAQEVPAVTTGAAGRIEVDFSKPLDSVGVEIVIGTKPATAVTGAHLHCGAAGVNQLPLPNSVLNLLAPAGGAPPVAFQDLGTSLKLEATYVGANLTPVPVATATCPVVINNIASLLNAIRSGLIYVEVHTTANPNGELRAQIFSK
jgi:hypothetical protein